MEFEAHDEVSCPGESTSHAIYYNGTFAEIFTPHFNCSTTLSSNISDIIKSFLLDDSYDLAAMPGCPRTGFALDIGKYTIPELEAMRSFHMALGQLPTCGRESLPEYIMFTRPIWCIGTV